MKDKINTIKVPLDPRYSIDRPMITSLMKRHIHGCFTVEIEETCVHCAFPEYKDDADCMCDGSEDMTYTREIDVPWDTCKEIYKSMVLKAAESYLSMSSDNFDPVETIGGLAFPCSACKHGSSDHRKEPCKSCVNS